jgi:hypothetical protein
MLESLAERDLLKGKTVGTDDVSLRMRQWLSKDTPRGLQGLSAGLSADHIAALDIDADSHRTRTCIGPDASIVTCRSTVILFSLETAWINHFCHRLPV